MTSVITPMNGHGQMRTIRSPSILHWMSRTPPPGIPGGFWFYVNAGAGRLFFAAAATVLTLWLCVLVVLLLAPDRILNAPWAVKFGLPLTSWLVMRRLQLRYCAAARYFALRLVRNGFRVCYECGYQLIGLPPAHQCPECGASYAAATLEAQWRPWVQQILGENSDYLKHGST